MRKHEYNQTYFIKFPGGLQAEGGQTGAGRPATGKGCLCLVEGSGSGRGLGTHRKDTWELELTGGDVGTEGNGSRHGFELSGWTLGPLFRGRTQGETRLGQMETSFCIGPALPHCLESPLPGLSSPAEHTPLNVVRCQALCWEVGISRGKGGASLPWQHLWTRGPKTVIEQPKAQ